MWYGINPTRYTAERDAIAQLAATSGWLTILKWRLEGFALCVDCEIALRHEAIPVTLKFGDHFPLTPPSVIPKSPERLSYHQYGRGGELCTALRPDNWLREYTGAMMLESAYQLLHTEEPDPETGDYVTAPEAETQTEAQNFRFLKHRMVLTASGAEQLRAASDGTELEVVDYSQKRAPLRLAITAIRQADGLVWSDPQIPTRLKSDPIAPNGVVVRRSIDKEILPTTTPEFLAALYGDVAPAPEALQVRHFFLVGPTDIRAFWVYKETAAEVPVIQMHNQARLPGRYAPLEVTRVGIVGCGSVGSKVAVSLARAGVCNFVLVDDDFLTVGNLVRHELDWSAVGSHKVHALADRINEVNGSASVYKLEHRLGGHEPSGRDDNVVSTLALCDVIIDASADERAFNFCAAAAMHRDKPMVWGRVYAGGIGGMVMRARPNLDPPPQVMRQYYNGWCHSHGVAAPVAAEPYGTAAEVPQIADDADVGVIAMHLARFTLDILTNKESTFPNSGYAIGLQKEWIFTQPFDVLPIEMPANVSCSWATPEIDFDAPENKAVIEDIATMIHDANLSSKKDNPPAAA